MFQVDLYFNFVPLVKPHLTREEYLQTQFVVNEFASGVGKELHKKLETRAKGMRNWVIKLMCHMYRLQVATGSQIIFNSYDELVSLHVDLYFVF